MNRVKMLTRALVAAGLIALAVAARAQYSGNVIRIGVLTDLSGLYSELGGQGSVEAAKMAVADFGGKVNGMPVEIISADHHNKADVASSRVREWVDQQGVDMVTDLLNSVVGVAVGRLTREKNFITINVAAVFPALTTAECTPYQVHYGYDTHAVAGGTAGAIVRQGGKSWFILTADHAFGHALEAHTEKVVKDGGGEVRGKMRHPLSASQFSPFLLQAQSSKAQIIGLANAGGDMIDSIRAAAELGITKHQSLAGLLVFITDIHNLGLEITQGLLLTDGWYWDLNDDTRKFGRRYFEKMKRMPSMVQAGVYSATLTYLKAVSEARTDDRDKVMARLRKTKIDDMFVKNGHIREDGRVMHDMFLMQVKKPEESRYPWDYFHVRATIPAERAFQPLSLSRCPLVRK